MGVSAEAFGVSQSETAPSADLGGSSKYSNANFEDRSGEGFHVNRSWASPKRVPSIFWKSSKTKKRKSKYMLVSKVKPCMSQYSSASILGAILI